MKPGLFLTAILIPFMSLAQYDTSYVMRFPGRLGVAIYQSKPVYNVNIARRNPVDGLVNELNYQTLANFITGVGLHYDKLSLFVGFKTPGEVEQQKRKGVTRSSQFNLAYTSMKLRIEASARFYTGFYDNNSPNNIDGFNDSSLYYQDENMKTTSLKLKGFYFFNGKKRFSYGAAYINNTRQLKSSGSFLLTSNIYRYTLTSDKPLVPPYLSAEFEPYDSINKFRTTGISAGIGYTHTFTIAKRLFLNLLGTLGVEGQHVNISEDEVSMYKVTRTTLSSYDFRSSFGYNSNRFYISFHTIIDGNLYTTPDVIINNNFINAIFIVGYRFGVNIKAIDKMQSK